MLCEVLWDIRMAVKTPGESMAKSAGDGLRTRNAGRADMILR